MSRPDPWRVSPEQATKSDGTCVRIVPRAMRAVAWRSGTVNADIGGGRFSDASVFLAALGVENIVFDPFNRDAAHNTAAADRLRGGGAWTATVLNVLNVLSCPLARDRVTALAADSLAQGGTAWFQVHEGDKSESPGPTSRGWQENRRLATYLPGIARHFASITLRGGLVCATDPLPAPWAGPDGPCRTLEQAEHAWLHGARVGREASPCPEPTLQSGQNAVSPNATRHGAPRA